MTSAAGSQAQPRPAQPRPRRAQPAGRRPGRQPDQPGQPRAGRDGQRGQAELDVPYVVDGLDERRRDQQDRRHHQPGHGDRRRVERAPAVGEPGRGQAAQREQGHREHQFPRARRGADQPLDRLVARPGQPGDLLLLVAGQGEQRGEHGRRGHRGRQPAQRDPGTAQQQRDAVRGQDQQPEDVEQAGQRHGRRVRQPPPPAAVGTGPEQQVGGDRGEHRLDRVGPGHLRVVRHVGRGREQQPGQQPGQRRDIQPAVSRGRGRQDQGGGPAGGRRGEPGRDHHGAQRGQPQRGGRGADHRRDQVHQQVVGAVHGILVPEQGEDLAERAADRVLGIRLVPP